MTQTNGNDHPQVISTINLAISHAATGRTPLAVSLLIALAETFPEAAGVRGYLGWFLLNSQRYDEALIQSRIAVELAPRSEKASLIYFHTMWKCGRHADALDEMKRYLSLRPSETYLNMIKEWSPE